MKCFPVLLVVSCLLISVTYSLTCEESLTALQADPVFPVLADILQATVQSFENVNISHLNSETVSNLFMVKVFEAIKESEITSEQILALKAYLRPCSTEELHSFWLDRNLTLAI